MKQGKEFSLGCFCGRCVGLANLSVLVLFLWENDYPSLGNGMDILLWMSTLIVFL